MPSHRSVAVLAGVVLLGIAARPSAQVPTFRSGTTLVEVDVIVKDSVGRFVPGLQPADFEIRDGGSSRPVEAFYVVEGRAPEAAGTAAPLAPAYTVSGAMPAEAARRVWVFWFDLEHMAASGVVRARRAAADFARTQFLPGDMGGVLAGGELINRRLTSVREELQAAVEGVRISGDSRSLDLTMRREWPRFVSLYEVYQVDRLDEKYVRRVIARACADDPQKCAGDADAPRLDVMQKARNLAGESRATATHALKTLESLIANLATLPGRKTVVYLSDGFVSEDISGALAPILASAARANVRIYAVDTRGLNRGTADSNILDAPPQQRVVTDKIFGAEPPDFDFSTDGPNSLAIDTGGLFIRNENDFARALREIADDCRSYYVLAFRPPEGLAQGTVRSIDVRLKRPGVVARSRKAYIVPPPPSAAKPVSAPVDATALPAGVPPEYLALIERHEPGRWDEVSQALSSWAVADIRSLPAWFRSVGSLLGRLSAKTRREAADAKDGRRLGQISRALGLSDDEANRADVSRLVVRAMVLDTDVGLDLYARSPEFADHYLRAAEELATDLSANHAAATRSWYVAVSEFLTDKAPWAAGELLNRGLKLLPNDASLWLALGTLEEVMASPDVQRAFVKARDDRTQTVVHGTMAKNKREYLEFRAADSKYTVEDGKRQLGRAEKALQRALALEPTNLEACVRLGHVLGEQGRAAEALTMLARVRAESGDAALRYLASMLEGRLHQDAGKLADARRCYEAALADVPGSQSASIALSQLSGAVGDATGALSHLRAGPLAAFSTEDPWWGYATGAGRQSASALSAIRAAARAARTPGEPW